MRKITFSEAEHKLILGVLDELINPTSWVGEQYGFYRKSNQFRWDYFNARHKINHAIRTNRR